MVSWLDRFLGRGWRWRMKSYRLGYAEGWNAAIETGKTLFQPTYDLGYQRGYEDGKHAGIQKGEHYTTYDLGYDRGYIDGKHAGIQKREHYTRMMVPDDERD